MDDNSAYERKRFHDLINEVHTVSAKIDILMEKDNNLKEDVEQIKIELKENRDKTSKLSQCQTALQVSVNSLIKFFWVILSVLVAGITSRFFDLI